MRLASLLSAFVLLLIVGCTAIPTLQPSVEEPERAKRTAQAPAQQAAPVPPAAEAPAVAPAPMPPPAPTPVPAPTNVPVATTAAEQPELSLTCRMLEAANCAYEVTEGGRLPKGFCPALKNFRDGIGFVGHDAKGLYDWLPGVKADYRDAAYIAMYPKEVLVVFRGTKTFNMTDAASLEDWINNANANLTTTSDLGNVHEGFNESLNNLWEGRSGMFRALDSLVKSPAWDRRPIYVVGHSKGGAIADLAALKLSVNHIKPVEVFTFAAARPGGATFKQKYDEASLRTMRFENQQDVVPHLPPTQVEVVMLEKLEKFKGKIHVGDYRSVGELTYIATNDSLRHPKSEHDENVLGQERLATFDRFVQDHPSDEVLAEVAEAHNIGASLDSAQDAAHHRYHYAACTER